MAASLVSGSMLVRADSRDFWNRFGIFGSKIRQENLRPRIQGIGLTGRLTRTRNIRLPLCGVGRVPVASNVKPLKVSL